FYYWTSWGSCSRTCGGGNQERQRIGTWILETRPCNKNNCPIDGGWSDWSKWSHCTKNVNGIQMRTRQCVNPKPQFGGKLCTGAKTTAMRGCTNTSRCRQDFSVRLLTIKGFPSNGSLQILSNGTWKDPCITNWNEAERNLVCQAQGYNGSSLGVCSNSGTNSSGNTTHSCEHLTQDCEEKISREIKCSVPVRLAGVDSINYAGRVEVFYQGKWGKISRSNWDINDVKVFCKQLGFQSVVAEFIGMDTKDENISVALSNVACTGQESVLASCERFDEKHNCVDNIGAQAFCEPTKLTISNELLFRIKQNSAGKEIHVFNIGSTVTVKCSKVETKLGQKISWYNGITGVKIKSGGRIQLNGLSLKIKNFQLDDAGTYECRGESSTRFYTIYANATFINKIRRQAFLSGGPGIIRCSALGNPTPHFKWNRQDGRSLQDRRFIQLANGSLMMKSIQAEDKGTYICAIKQPRGSEPSSEKSQSINVMNISGIQVRIRRCVNPYPQLGEKPCPGPDLTVIRGCTNISRCREDFRVSFRTTGVPVRLAGVDGVNYAGRVEVFYQGKWGDEWDINDVKVVCRQLGFQNALAEFLGMDTKDENISVVSSDENGKGYGVLRIRNPPES
ncbi:Thrombospondin-2, partial [Acropora cervicornis]